jgi:hypothetical protein
VSSPERDFATALIDVDLMAWLVDRVPRLALTWEVQRGDVLCRTQGLEPSDFRSSYARTSNSRDGSDPARPASEAQGPRTR